MDKSNTQRLGQAFRKIKKLKCFLSYRDLILNSLHCIQDFIHFLMNVKPCLNMVVIAIHCRLPRKKNGTPMMFLTASLITLVKVANIAQMMDVARLLR